jgi:hypothetical protein
MSSPTRRGTAKSTKKWARIDRPQKGCRRGTRSPLSPVHRTPMRARKIFRGSEFKVEGRGRGPSPSCQRNADKTGTTKRTAARSSGASGGSTGTNVRTRPLGRRRTRRPSKRALALAVDPVAVVITDEAVWSGSRKRCYATPARRRESRSLGLSSLSGPAPQPRTLYCERDRESIGWNCSLPSYSRSGPTWQR